jgi:hypothetical protein
MRRSGAVLVVASALGVGTVFVSRDASALGPVDVEVGARVGAGTNPFSAPPNPLGFGLGGRAGVSFLGLYGGLSAMYYFGESAMPGGLATSEHSVLYGVEGGYGIKFLGLVTVRGQVGLGNYAVSYTGMGQTTVNNLYLEPGITAMVSFGILFVGADATLLVLPSIVDPATPNANSSWDTAFTAHGQVGITF